MPGEKWFDINLINIVFKKTNLSELSLIEYKLESFNLPTLAQLRNVHLFAVDLKVKTLYKKAKIFYKFDENQLIYCKFNYPNYVQGAMVTLDIGQTYNETEFCHFSDLFSVFKKTLFELINTKTDFEKITL